MERSEIERRVIEIVVAQFTDASKDKVSLTTAFQEDLASDSLDDVELAMELEERFGLDISDEESHSLLTVGDAVNFVERKLREKR